MKTNDELETLIQNLIERMNRVEATMMQAKPVKQDLKKPIEEAIAILDRGVSAIASRVDEICCEARNKEQIIYDSSYRGGLDNDR